LDEAKQMSKDESLPTILPYRSILPDGSLDLRGNGVTVAYNLVGPPPESATLADLASASRQLAGAFLHLGTNDLVQVLFHRRPASEPPEREFPCRAAALVDAERRAQFAAESHWTTLTHLFLTHVFERPVKSWLRAVLLASNGPQRQARNELLREYALSRFAAFEDAAASAVTLTRLPPLETFRALMMATTYHNYPAALPEPHVRLNEVIGCERFIGGMAPYINSYHLRPLCITAYPSYTVPQILAVLLRHKGRMTVSARFICLDPYDARQQLELEKHHWNREILGTVWKTVKDWFGKDVKAEQDTIEQLEDINTAIAAAAAGMSFGWCTIVAVVYDEEAARADLRVRDLQRDCHALSIMARIEDLNAAEAIESTWPANGTSNIRRPLITGANFADLILPATPWGGTPYIDSEMYPPQTPTPLVLGGSGNGQPFHFPTHVNGVAHMIAIGPTGVGKTTLEAVLICAYLSIPNVRITCYDSGYSSWPLAHMLGADYREIGADDTPALCPLALLDKPNGDQWLFGWLERAFARFDFVMDERQSEELAYRLRQAKREGIRTLSGLRAIIPGEQQRMRNILRQYTTWWKHIFDGEPSEATNSRIVFYEINRLRELGEQAAGPAMELLLQLTTAELDGSPAWIVVDEWHTLLANKIAKDWFQTALRTWRRLNTGFVGFTQSLVELVENPACALLLESFPGRIFLPNHAANSELVRNLYRRIGLNDNKIACIASARPRAEYFYDSEIGSRKFKIELGDIARAICGSTAYPDVQRARAVFAESPDGLFLDAWLSERLPG
jgi:type IV secretion system protein TrbE